MMRKLDLKEIEPPKSWICRCSRNDSGTSRSILWKLRSERGRPWKSRSLRRERPKNERKKERLLLMLILTAGARRTDGRRKRSSLRGSRNPRPKLPICGLDWSGRTRRPLMPELNEKDCELMCIGWLERCSAPEMRIGTLLDAIWMP